MGKSRKRSTDIRGLSDMDVLYSPFMLAYLRPKIYHRVDKKMALIIDGDDGQRQIAYNLLQYI